jgi:hypothetical protein
VLDLKEVSHVHAYSRGGLGNQLFILAAAHNLALRLNSELVINSALHSMSNSRPFRSQVFINNKLVPTSVSDVKWSRWKLSLQNFGLYSFCDVTESNYLQAEIGHMWGYFQSQIFHEEFRDQIYESYSTSLADSVANSLSFFPTSDSITVHIRRGDYAKGKAAKVHGCIDYDYYARILRSEEGKIYVVSDDSISLQLLRQKLPGRQIQLVQGNSELEDLYFLSMSKRLVIANSSFSWWGAALGVHEKEVHAPETWYRDGKKVLFPIQNKDWHIHRTTFEDI